MSSSSLQTPASFSPASLWRSPTFTIARFMLKSHIRSGWILGDIVFIWFLYAAFFFEFGGDVAYFYGIMNEALSVLAVLSTIVMTAEGNDCSYVSSTLAPLFPLSLYSWIDCGNSLSTGAIFLTCSTAGTGLS